MTLPKFHKLKLIMIDNAKTGNWVPYRNGKGQMAKCKGIEKWENECSI